MTDKTFSERINDWRELRRSKLLADDGWLNLVGLWWLDDGPIGIGSASDCDAILPHGPDFLGTVSFESGKFSFGPADTALAHVTFVIDRKAPTRFVVGDFLLEAVMLAGRPALRARDLRIDTASGFKAIENFPADENWRIVADWVPLAKPIETSVDTVAGAPSEVTITHKAIFVHDGRSYELLPTHGTPAAPQFVLRDATSGRETYPASRFLFGEDIKDGSIVLDFNKAINPPCAFTDFAICPLPPPENVLPFRIEAGEKTWHA